jgi:putative phosphoribosyl transferase
MEFFPASRAEAAILSSFVDWEQLHTTREQIHVEERTVRIPISPIVLDGDLALPDSAIGVVVFAHGSGNSRHSPRNRYVAQELQEAILGTLLIDLLTSDEEAADSRTAELRFDIELLASRLIEATRWLVAQSETANLPISYFGASTGAAAALVAASELPTMIAAVVSRGGRPDLAGAALRQVVAPTLLIVGSNDPVVVELNRKAPAELAGEKELAIVLGATHLFEEPGALETVAQLARSWLVVHLRRTNDRRHAA